VSPYRLSELRNLEKELTSWRPERRPGTVVHQLRVWFTLLLIAMLAAVLFGLLPVLWAVRIFTVAAVALAAYAGVTEVLSRFERPRRTRRSLPRLRRKRMLPAYFERADRSVELASATIGGYDPLRRRLVAIAEQRLAARGVERGSDAARNLLGDEATELLERVPHEERFRKGPRPAQLRRLLERLEQL
jgi:hypothetical protein